MDRAFRRGAVSLSSLWLQKASSMSYDEHCLLKELLSSEASFEERQAERQRLQTLAADDEQIAELLRLESEARGGELDEPSCIPCKSLVPG